MSIKKEVIMSRILTLLIAISMIACVFSFSTEMAYADEAAVQAEVQKYGASQFGSLLTTDAGVGASADYTSITVTDSASGVSTKYYYRKDNETAILNKAKSLRGQQQISDLDEYYSLEADTKTASDLVSGLKGPISTFLGILVTFITVGMTVFTAFDLCYIAFPVFRGKMDDAKANGTKGITRTNNKGETKLNIVTEDAQFAVISAETAQTGQSAYLIYFKKRIISFVILAVLIFILLTGNINILTNIGVKLASGILEAINNSF